MAWGIIVLARLTSGTRRILATSNPFATVVELDAAKAELTGESNLKDAFTRRLTIPNDGHPNKRFHALMGQAAAPTIRQQLAAP